MLRLILTRLLAALPNLAGVVVITFVLTRALPGDPAAYFAGGAATQEAIEQVRRQLGLQWGGVERALARLVDDDLAVHRRQHRDDLVARLAAHQQPPARARIADAQAGVAA